MKQTAGMLLFFLAALPAVFAQSAPLAITFKNNSLLPRHYTFVTYAPGSDRNGTDGVLMAPGGTKRFTVPAGTRFYLADSDQKETVMGGRPLTGKPFYTVGPADNGKTILLRKL